MVVLFARSSVRMKSVVPSVPVSVVVLSPKEFRVVIVVPERGMLIVVLLVVLVALVVVTCTYH